MSKLVGLCRFHWNQAYAQLETYDSNYRNYLASLLINTTSLALNQ